MGCKRNLTWRKKRSFLLEGLEIEKDQDPIMDLSQIVGIAPTAELALVAMYKYMLLDQIEDSPI